MEEVHAEILLLLAAVHGIDDLLRVFDAQLLHLRVELLYVFEHAVEHCHRDVLRELRGASLLLGRWRVPLVLGLVCRLGLLLLGDGIFLTDVILDLFRDYIYLALAQVEFPDHFLRYAVGSILLDIIEELN